MYSDLKMPPESCPNDGVCLSIFPRLLSVEEDVKLLRGCAGKVDHIETVMAERDKTSNKIWNAMLCLLGLSVIHFAAFLVWMGGTNERISQFKENDLAHAAAISRLEHGIKP